MLKSQPREVMVGCAGLLVILLTLAVGKVNSTIVLITASNFSLPFFNIEASFAPQVPAIGIRGVVFVADPSNACKPLQIRRPNEFSAFLLVERGECDFVTKVKNAQDAGYTAAIISNNKDGQDLVTMSGSGTGINIFAVFVSKQVGKVLQLCAGNMDCRCYLFPPFEKTARSAIAISFISLVTFFAVSLTLFFARRHCLRLTGPVPLQPKPRGMPSKEIEALPVILFDIEVNATVETCVICLEEYASGEKLRVLPCGHEFHVACIDQWLTTWRTFCPICKQDARCKRTNEPPSEHVPLLGSFAAHSCCMASSVLASDQSSQIRSPVQNTDHIVNSLTSLHAAEQFLFHPIPLFCEVDDEAPLSSSHISSTVAASSTLPIPHNICSLNCSPCACHTPSSADCSTSIVEGDVVIQMTSTE